MASILNVDKIRRTSGTTDALTIDSSDNVYIPGHVVQVVQSTFATETSTTSSSYSDTGLSASITPRSTSSKILVVVSLGSSGVSNSSGADARGRYAIIRGSTNIHTVDVRAYDYGNSGSISFTPGCITFLDSPSTTSATTYKLQQKAVAATIRVCNDGYTIAMQLLEIAQ